MTVARQEAGFTLLELLVAMTVLGVLTGLLASGLSFGTRIWERERSQLDVTSELQLTQDVLRRLLTQALPLPSPARGAAAPPPTFVGSDDSIEFLGPPPAQMLGGGVYAYRVLTRTDADGVRLVLQWRLRPPQGGTARTQVTNAELEEAEKLASEHEVILLKALSRAEFAYFGAVEEGSEARWRDDWRSSTKPPLLVKLMIGFRPDDPRTWPDLLVAPRIALESSE